MKSRSKCKWPRLVGLSALALLGPGCSIRQDRETALYRSVLDRDAIMTGRLHPYDEPLSLTEALFLANTSNESLGQQGEAYVRAIVARRRALASFLPTVSLDPSFSGTTHVTPGAFRTPESSSSLQVPLLGSINLFRGGADLSLVEGAEAQIARQRELLADLQSSVLLEAALVYYQVLRSERRVVVLESSVSVQEARVADIEARARNGLATTLDVAQSQARLQSAAVALTRARQEVLNGRAALARFLGLGHDLQAPLAHQLIVPPDLDDRAASEHCALELRQDLLAASHAVESARRGIEVAMAQYYPSVSFNAAAFLAPDLFTDSTHWGSVLVAHLPILTAGVIHADVREAWSHLREAALAELAARRRIGLEVATVHNDLHANAEATRGLREREAAAGRAHDLARQAYSNGLATNLEVLAAQDELLQAQLELASMELDRAVLYLTLLRVRGQLDLGTATRLLPPRAG